MTEYEMMDLIGTFQTLAVTEIMAYFTVLSAYCIVAFMVGPKLSRAQVIMITGLYLIMSLFLVWATGSHLMGARSLVENVTMIAGNDFRSVIVTYLKPHQVVIPLLLIGVVSGLKFMWDVRHPKTE
jgi:hypothetical protein